ncbi:hypothetical protein MYU51_009077 [Penicillium brevicompactum]|uniref:uncharacterized protein n=1 Tax=Penicillium brevicompactum TaxID=5074 RepID=UPI002540FFF4|nr:uncharacterized protein N7506_006569 [Penicillium brevicompactum]KAJ5332786.1 hypothetical protein N7506_006569 [Penicillium brevicompactum]
MEIQIISDLHLETPASYDIFEITPKAPYLALLGDIGTVKDTGFFPFIETQLSKFSVVYFLLGNHEPYHSTWAETKEELHRFSTSVNQRRVTPGQNEKNKSGSFVFLDQTRYDASANVTVLGCTLFSQVDETHKEHVSFGLNDFYHINDWTVEEHTAAHQSDVAWLNAQVSQIATEEPHRKIVVFTHHSPVTQDARAVDPRHANSRISSGFATDLSSQECWKSPLVRLWAFGHTHFNVNYVEDAGKMVVSNQRGYYSSQAKGFDGDLVVKIDE